MPRKKIGSETPTGSVRLQSVVSGQEAAQLRAIAAREKAGVSAIIAALIRMYIRGDVDVSSEFEDSIPKRQPDLA